MRRIYQRRAAASKKNSGDYTAAHAALGGRTLKTGQSRWFVGYKKHTLRLWLPTRHPSVTLVPLVSWLTPGNVAEGGLLRPSLHWCRRHLGWWPGIVVADMDRQRGVAAHDGLAGHSAGDRTAGRFASASVGIGTPCGKMTRNRIIQFCSKSAL